MNKRSEGTLYERLAAGWLEKQGFRILECNYRTRYGEIDIIAREGRTLVFAEVKYRRTSVYGEPIEAVDHRKQYKICRVADWYAAEKQISQDDPCRFDVIAVSGESFRLFRNAFEYRPVRRRGGR